MYAYQRYPMPFEHVPQDRFILNSLIRMMAASATQSGDEIPYDTAIGFGVDEIVKDNMRKLSQERAEIGVWEDLLEHAVRQSADQLQSELITHRLRFDLAPYLDHARESLEAASKEMNALNRK